jgi:N-acetylglucosaminyldiphosphoundecaprenol N-acetyl-beta-D-mannosaminyltransferase
MNKGLAISGVPLDNVSMQQALDRIEEFIREGGMHQVATANVDYLVNATTDPEYRRSLCMCDLVVADGMPIVWASRLLGLPLPERVPGSDLVPQLVRLSSAKGYRLFLLGASPAVSDSAAHHMELLSPGVRIVGRLSPPIRPLDEFENGPILEAIERARPDILLVAFGSPKQEKWISRNREFLKAHVAIGIGGTLEFLSDAIPRAPGWMQEYSLEWLYRFWQEPRRLGPRYLRDAVWMANNLTAEICRNFISPRSSSGLRLSLDVIGAIHIVRVAGAMTGPELTQVGRVVSAACDSRGPVVVDLSETSHIGPDGCWTLAGLLRKATQQGCELWLSGLSPSLVRTLRAARFDGLINSAASALDAIRKVSRGRLQMNLELGENWAACRISGDIPPNARATLEEICHSVRMAHQHFEFDASGMKDFDPSRLLTPIRPSGRVVYVDSTKVKTAGVA